MRTAIVGSGRMNENLFKASLLMDATALKTQYVESPHIWIVYSQEGPTYAIDTDGLKFDQEGTPNIDVPHFISKFHTGKVFGCKVKLTESNIDKAAQIAQAV